jgi:hypothetical protein
VARQSQPKIDETAVQIARKARVARPLASAVTFAASVGAGLWIAALLTALVVPKTNGEHALIAMIALGATIAAGFVQIRALRHRWNSTPAVSRRTRPVARALLAGVVVLGALELIAYGTRAVFHGDPFGAAGRLALAGVAAVLGLGYERLALDERVKRWIG